MSRPSSPLSVVLYAQGAGGLTTKPCAHSSEDSCRGQVDTLSFIWADTVGRQPSSTHPRPRAGNTGNPVWGSAWLALGWASSYQVAAASATGPVELTGATMQWKAADLAGVGRMATSKWAQQRTRYSKSSQLRLDDKGRGPKLFIAVNIWKRRHCGVKSTNCNNGLFFVMYSQPCRTVGLCSVVSMGYKEWIQPVRLDCLFDRFTKVLNEKNAADAE